MADITCSDLLNEDLFPGNTHAYEQLKASLAGQQLVAFTGAGTSAPLYPTWQRTLHDLLATAIARGLIPNNADRDAIVTQLDKDPLEAASTLEEIFSPNIFRSLLASTFRTKDQCTAAHELIIDIGIKGAITLNYDDGLEIAYARGMRRLPNTVRSDDRSEVLRWQQGDLFQNGGLPVLHWHGIPVSPQNMVFSSDDYDRFYADDFNIGFVRDIWTSSQLLVVGFSFSDPYLTRLAEHALRTLVTDNRHFGIIGHRSGEAVAPLVRKQFSKKYRLTPIFYEIHTDENGFDDHSLLPLLLKFLCNTPTPTDLRQERSPSELQAVEPTASTSTAPHMHDAHAELERLLFVSPTKKTLFVTPRLVEPTSFQTFTMADEHRPVEFSEIILSRYSYHIFARPEFGSTTLCRKLRSEFARSGVDAHFRDADLLPTYRKKLQQEFVLPPGGNAQSSVLILDEFDTEKHERLLKEVVALGVFQRVLLISKTKSGDLQSSMVGSLFGLDFNYLVLTQLERADIRTLASDMFDTSDSDFISAVVEKVYNDLLDLCIPLTPSNIIMYLKVLYREGDFHPLNRVQIVDRYIHEMLRAAGDAYKDSFNARNKIDVVSAFVFDLYSSQKTSCGESDWFTFCKRHKAAALIDFDERSLLRDLLRERILLKVGLLLVFKYRFFYSYFLGRHVANRSAPLAEFMARDYHFSVEGLVEVIAAVAADSSALITDLTSKVEGLQSGFEDKYALAALDPFKKLDWPRNEQEEERLWQPVAAEMAAGPRDTAEIDVLKRSLLAEQRTENQEIVIREFNQLERKLIAYSMALTAAIVNSDLQDGNLKKRALDAIFGSIATIYQIGLIFSPVIARQPYFVWNGILFSGWHDPASALKNEDRQAFAVSVSMPRSVTSAACHWIGTKKLGEVYKVLARNERLEGFRKLLVFSLVLRSKPMDWHSVVDEMVRTTDKNSFYLRSMLYAAVSEFKDEVNTNAERERLKRLIALIRAKRGLKKSDPGAKAVSKVLDRLEQNDFFEKIVGGR